ncbi:plasma membrane snare protein-like protein [Boeremia exigua]|uniref:plasma membrane snare protein-like protein n=1 Tax=Boeremia exigua TaxID=749465 RepID=UPI001E8CB237|nr:plasma membrane snare protein-like protein [Boeremia exigua]KAH6638413.1 plasma membrane snare protein-like protein [Boeremia exigua]
MGFLSKKKDDGADTDRKALFGSRKSEKAPAQSNPYAAAPGQDPYAQPPPQYSSSNDGYRQEKTAAVTGPGQQYGGGPRGGGGGGYGAQGGSYGAQGGYGNDRYGGSPAPQQSARGPGGYGGLGRTSSTDTDANRNDLFGNAAQRQQQQPQQQPGGYGSQSGGYGQATPGGYGASSGGYGAYGDRELTAEEQEEEDISATKQEIKFMKQQDVSSTRNALRLAQQAEETGRDTLARLGAQGERIHNTERNLDLASTQNRIAEEKARELKTLNKSMFAMHVSNPFTASSRREARDAKIMDNHHRDREARDATRKAAWESSARQDDQNRTMQGMSGAGKKASLADRAKFQFEADSDDDEMENEIDANLDALHGAAKRLNQLGRAMGEETDNQNKHIERINLKTDKVDDQIAMNRARLDRIK